MSVIVRIKRNPNYKDVPEDKMTPAMLVEEGKHTVAISIRRIVRDEVTKNSHYEFDTIHLGSNPAKGEVVQHSFSDEDFRNPEILKQVRSLINETTMKMKTIELPDKHHIGEKIQKIVPDPGALGKWIEVVDEKGALVTSIPEPKK